MARLNPYALWYEALTLEEAKEVEGIDKLVMSLKETQRLLMEKREGIRNRASMRRLHRKRKEASEQQAQVSARPPSGSG